MTVPEPKISSKRSAYSTPWFELVEKTIADQPHYSISTTDYVTVFAVTSAGKFPLVRQFRPAVERVTLELPSGHVDRGQTPEQAARNELREETGFVANQLISLGRLLPDTGRLGNWMWCFFAPNVEMDRETEFTAQAGIEPVLYDKSLRDLLVATPDFSSALNRAAILTALAEGHVRL